MSFKKTIFLHDFSGEYQYFKHLIFNYDISKTEILSLVEEWLISLYPDYPEIQEYIKKNMHNPMFYIECLNRNELMVNLFDEKFLEISKKYNFDDSLDFLIFLNFEKAFPSFIEYLEEKNICIDPLKDYKLIN